MEYYPDLEYNYMNNLSNDINYTPGAPTDVVYEAHNFKKNMFGSLINESAMPAGGGGGIVTPYQPFQYYSGIFGWEPGEAIARTRRNMLILVSAIVAVVVLATVGVIALTLAK